MKIDPHTGQHRPIAVYLCEVCGRTITWFDTTSIPNRHCEHFDQISRQPFIQIMTQIYSLKKPNA
jgi:hypothetical protein